MGPFGADRVDGKRLTSESEVRSGDSGSKARVASLDDWQTRLSTHFDGLMRARQDAGWPLFALEHGLGEREREFLSEAVRKAAGIDGSLESAPLPWIVYAAEVGYGYSGEEYWYTFKAATPKWPDTQRDRDRVRRAFRVFARRYGGAEPTGAWAEHFGIIAWPITHSILPRDLQRQLAEVLFDARLTFRAETFASAESLGRHLSARSGGASARFRQFAKDSALLGQIALALLLHDGGYGQAQDASEPILIHPPTLERIIADLNAERDARDWLAEARDAARYRIRGLSRIPFRLRDARQDVDNIAHGNQPREELRRLISRPRFLLRRGLNDRWSVWVQFPNLAALLPAMPRAGDVLARAQGRVGESGGPMLAGGRILSEAWPSIRLAEWPSSTASLLHFDGAPPELRALLDASFRIPPGDEWLFLIGAEGQARELTTRVLRPGESYVLLMRAKTEKPAGGLIPTDIACAGVHGLRIDVPVSVSQVFTDILAVLGLEVARTLEVWPAGLPLPDWSGDGTAETLAGEPLMLAIRSERPLKRIEIAVDGCEPTSLLVVDGGSGDCAFVVVPPLPDGRHQLTVAATIDAEQEGQSCETAHSTRRQELSGLRGSLNILVRLPRPSGAGAETGALSFAVHPRAPSLEDLWEDRCELHVAAPGALWIRCHVALMARGATTPIAQRDFRVASPLTTVTWREAFKSQVREAIAEAYDEAHACALGFSAGALGFARVVVERDFTPLRWVIRDGGGEVVLVDSKGDPNTKVTVFDAQSPDVGGEVDREAAAIGLRVPSNGALFSASSGSTTATVVAVPKQRITSLANLAQRPSVQNCRKDAASLERLVHIAAGWERARLGATSITSQRRDAAVNALQACIIGTIAGDRWARAEAEFEQNGDRVRSVEALRALVANRPDEKGVVAVLSLRAAELARSAPSELEAIFVRAVSTFIAATDAPQLAPFALRLATSPSAAVRWTTSGAALQRHDDNVEQLQRVETQLSLRDALGRLLAIPVILRAARLAVALVAGPSMEKLEAGLSKDIRWTNSPMSWD